MKVIFSDGRFMTCETVHSNPLTYNGTVRDCFTFVFPEGTPIDAILAHFTPENTDQIWLEDEDGNRYLHEHYTIRISAGTGERGRIINSAIDEDHREVSYVKMCKETTMETRVRLLQEAMDLMLVSELEG